MSKYDAQNITKMILKTGRITFLSVITIGKDILRICCKTYSDVSKQKGPLSQIINDSSWMLTDSKDIIMKDKKKRKASTLEKAGISQEEHEHGITQEQAAKMLSDYFIKNDCIIIASKAGSKVRMLNKMITESRPQICSTASSDTIETYTKCSENNSSESMKLISCELQFDIDKMLKKCEIAAEIKTGPEEIEAMIKALKKCLKTYSKLEKISKNKCECTLSYAYYWESENVCDMMWIICVTSIGSIYYDTIYDRWGITQKEHKKTGLVIEHFDINDIKRQLMERYHVKTMEELKLKLIAIRKAKEERIAV